jgi:hypothetical protein
MSAGTRDARCLMADLVAFWVDVGSERPFSDGIDHCTPKRFQVWLAVDRTVVGDCRRTCCGTTTRPVQRAPGRPW